MKTDVKKSVILANLLTTIYAGLTSLTLSLLLDLTLVYKAILFFIGSMALFQAYRFKRKYEQGKISGIAPLIVPSAIFTVLGTFFLVLSLLFMEKNDLLPPSVLMAIRIIAGLSVVGLVALGVSIYQTGVFEKRSK